MSAYRYVLLDPTGNLTCLVLDPVPPEAEPAVTRELLKQCEQVAYLEPASVPGARAAIRLMGGEFCGNAAMASAAWLLRDSLAKGEEAVFPLQVSGAEQPVDCRVLALEHGFEGTVRMPRILEVSEEEYFGFPLIAVRMEGIRHLIYTGAFPEPGDAEFLLRRIAGILRDEAIGLMQWDRQAGYLRPLVYVRGSGTLVWERGCGSGSAAVGAWEALRADGPETVTDIRQPGGIIRVAAEKTDGKIVSVRITGRILLGKEVVLQL